MIRTKQQIIDDFITNLNAVQPDLDTNNTTVKNIIIDAPATQMSTTYDDLAHAQRIQSLQYINDMTTDELNAIAYNYKLTRLSGVASTGTERMFRKILPSSPITIPVNSVISTNRSLDTAATSFQTLQTRIFSNVPGGHDGWDSAEAAYYIDVPIQALSVGALNNTASNTITTFSSNIKGIDFIYNPLPTTGGVDEESNETLAERIRSKASGGQLNTLNGYKSLVTNNFILRDVTIIGPSDPSMIRNPYGNAVDIVFIGNNLINKTDAIIYNIANPPLTHVFDFQPIDTDTAAVITGTDASSQPMTLQEGLALDYHIVNDTSTIGNSNRAQDKVAFHIQPIHTPLNGSTININYVYNKQVSDIQTIIDLDENKVVGSDDLDKQATVQLVDISFSMSGLTGYDFETVKNDVITSIGVHMSELILGQTLQQYDIITWAGEAEGIDEIDLHTIVPTDDVTVDKLTYIALNSIVITEL